METDSSALIEVFSGTLWEAEMIRSLLEDSEIESFTRNSLLGSNLYDPIYSEGVKVMILSSDRERAQKVVDDYRL